MNAEDAARLELAKRAYRATGPSALEVQTSVRRARLALLRPPRRRKWLLKGLVLVVLALGSLAYAKPHALGELALLGLPSRSNIAGKQRPATNRAEEQRAVISSPVAPAPPALAAASTGVVGMASPSGAASSEPTLSPREASPEMSAKAEVVVKPAPRRAASGAASSVPRSSPAAEAPREAGVSDWGRVGQALARGDEASALSALGRLSESEDQHTRDKADLGRAQLQMANGDRAAACSLARSVSRHAGDHIERQARQLLERCDP